MRKHITMLVFTALTLCGFAQKSSFKNNDYFIEGGLRYGSALYHPKNNDYLEDLYFGSIEVRFGLQTRGLKSWEAPLKYPIIGFALRYTDYTDFGDPINVIKARNAVMGKNIAFWGYLQGNIIQYKCFTWHYQIGMGAAYFTKIYNEDVRYSPNGETDGSTNDLISLHVNPYINFQMGFDFKVSPQFDLCLNANFLHSSNGSLNMPNSGINEIQGIAGVRYHFNKNVPRIEADSVYKFKPSNALFFTVDPGCLLARYDDYYYLKLGASLGYVRKVYSFLNVGAAFEMQVVTRLQPSKHFDPNDQPSPEEMMPKVIHIESLYAFTELVFGRFAFHVGVGGHVYRGPGEMARKADLANVFDGEDYLKKISFVYERVGFKIFLGKNHDHFIGATLFAHAPLADYLALTYGYKFYQFGDIKKGGVRK
ncbi:hypothetical protein FACS1894178_6360 [Bacteroidia bacterium]|nr:hypothetical protein FACS1894178_6360 [Bacteroidia bacterium]